MSLRLKKDKDGNIVTCPITGWGITSVAGVSLILTLEYVETETQLERGERRQLQTLLTPSMALEFAEALKRAANGLLGPQSSNTTIQ